MTQPDSRILASNLMAKQARTTMATKISHSYGPVSLAILNGFLDEDEEDLPDPRLQRPSSTVAVVSGGGSETPSPPPLGLSRPPPLPDHPMNQAFGRFKPPSSSLLAGFSDDEEGEDEKPRSTTSFKSPIPQQVPRGYKPTSLSLLEGFSDDDDAADIPPSGQLKGYKPQSLGLDGLSDSDSCSLSDHERRKTRRNRLRTTPARRERRNSGRGNSRERLVPVDSPKSATPPNQPGYFTPEYLSFGQRYKVAISSTTTASPAVNLEITNKRTLLGLSKDETQECIVCTDDLPVSSFPSASVTTRCTHPPSTCLSCIANSIRSDLNSKLWSEIRCPECSATLQYDDVQRFADEETRERYQNLSFRSAVSGADNFVWCTAGCGYGQVHDGGNAQPIVVCLLCRAKSCFYHKSAWHENLSCDEFEEMQKDPINFRSRFERENMEAEENARKKREQEEADWRFAQSLLDAETREIERERLKQEQEARLKREKEERRLAKEREEKLRRERELLAKRKKEEEASVKKIGSTTKPCPKCLAPIEKRSGCDHMTCIKCTHEFCYDCLASYREVLKNDNSLHAETCRWHPSNLS